MKAIYREDAKAKANNFQSFSFGILENATHSRNARLIILPLLNMHYTARHMV